MKLSEFLEHLIHQTISFFHIGKGAYNHVFLTTNAFPLEEQPEQAWVYKRPQEIHEHELPMNDSSRIYRKFKEIHPEMPVYEIADNQGIVMPYFETKTEDDELIAATVLSIYQQTRMVIADGCNPSNFAFLNQKLMCIDMDLALRRGSILSDMYFNQVVSTHRYDRFFKDAEISFGTKKTIETIKTLFYLEEQLDGVDFDTHLITSWVVAKLSEYRRLKIPFNFDSICFLKAVEELAPQTPDNLLKPTYIEEYKTQAKEEIPQIIVTIAEREAAFVSSMPSTLLKPKPIYGGFFSYLNKRSLPIEVAPESLNPLNHV